MTSFICTIRVLIAWFSALTALRDDIVGNTFTESVIEHKVLSDEFAWQSLLLHLTGVFDNSTFQLINILKSFVFEIRAGFLTTDSACTVHQQVFIFFVFGELLFNDRERFAERVHIRSDRIYEMADFTLIVIPHVDDDRVIFLKHL